MVCVFQDCNLWELFGVRKIEFVFTELWESINAILCSLGFIKNENYFCFTTSAKLTCCRNFFTCLWFVGEVLHQSQTDLDKKLIVQSSHVSLGGLVPGRWLPSWEQGAEPASCIPKEDGPQSSMVPRTAVNPIFCRSGGHQNSGSVTGLCSDIKNTGAHIWAKKELEFEFSFQDPK